MIVGFVVLFALQTGATPPTAADVDSTWRRESRQWFEEIEPSGTVRVTNPIGNVYARFGGYEPRVEILANLQHDTARHSAPEITVERIDGGIHVSTRRVAAEAGGEGSEDGPRERIDLVLFVPLGSPVDIETERDDVEIKGVESDVTVRSIEGDLRLRSIGGRITAKTARGAIAATLETGVTDEPQSLSTETGPIEVHLWEDADLQVEIATSGVISTDFSIDIEHRRFEEPGKRAHAVIGAGSARLVLRSNRGPVSLLRLERETVPQETGEADTTVPTNKE